MKLTDEDIQGIEKFVREELLDLFQEKCRANNFEFNNADKVHFFGLFESNTKNFRFLSGDRKLIEMIVQHANKVYQQDNPNNINSFDIPSNYKVASKDTHFFPFGLYFGKSSARNKPITTNSESVELSESTEPTKPEDMKEFVCLKLNKMIKSLGVTVSGEFGGESIKIVNTGNGIQAIVTCTLCQLHRKNNYCSR